MAEETEQETQAESESQAEKAYVKRLSEENRFFLIHGNEDFTTIYHSKDKQTIYNKLSDLLEERCFQYSIDDEDQISIIYGTYLPIYFNKPTVEVDVDSISADQNSVNRNNISFDNSTKDLISELGFDLDLDS